MAAAQPLKIRMVAGLGNPGDEYAETRHNAGLRRSTSWPVRPASRTGKTKQAPRSRSSISTMPRKRRQAQIVLVKPQSYMNTSGGPISKLCREYKIKAEELLVIHDELDIPAGDVRVKVGGGHAGHNGLRSIIDKMGSRDLAVSAPASATLPARWPWQTTCSSSCAPAKPRISRTPAPAPQMPPVWPSSTRNLRPRSRKRRRFRQREALKPTI